MKIKFFVLIVCLTLLTPLHHAFALPDFSKVKVNQKISLPELDSGKEFYVLEKEEQDITGDGNKKLILLVGEKTNPDSLLTKNVHILIMDPTMTKPVILLLRKDASYSPKLYFGDMDGDKVPEILNEFPSEDGQRKYYILASFKNNELKLFSGKEGLAKFFIYKGTFKDNFVMDVTNEHLDITIPVTLYGYKDTYIKNDVYSENGVLKQDVSTFSDDVLDMHFEDKDKDGRQELYANQVISGISVSNTVASIFSRIQMFNGKLALTEVDVCGKMFEGISE